MRVWLTVIFLFYFLTACTQIQLGLFGGVSDYNGDVLDHLYKFSRPAGGLTLGYQLPGRLSVRLGATFGKIEGADSVSAARGLSRRNLSFQSELSEASFIVEYDLFSMENLRWTPFAYSGLAVYCYDPYTFDQHGQKFYLQPLSTEGQGLSDYPNRKPYPLTSLAIPLGGGIKFALSDQWLLAAQIGLRITTNDYLDDVSTSFVDQEALLNARGPKAVELAFRSNELPGSNETYPKEGSGRGRSGKFIYNDFYYFSGLHLVYRFGESGGSSYSGKGWNRKRLRCFAL